MCSCVFRCKSLAEFRRPQAAEEGGIVFSGGVYVGKHSSQAASVWPFPGTQTKPSEAGVCLGEEGQGSKVSPGRQAGGNGADFDPTMRAAVCIPSKKCLHF